MGVVRGCPLPKDQQPRRCKYCPLDKEERIKRCNWFRGIREALSKSV